MTDATSLSPLWEWVGPHNPDRLVALIRALPEGLLPAQAAATLIHPHAGPPLCRWACRIGEALGLGEASARAAVAIGIVSYDDGAEGPDVLRRWSVAHRLVSERAPARVEGGLARWWLARAGEPRARLACNPVVGDGTGTAARLAAGVCRLDLLFGLPALLAERDPEPWLELARALTPLVDRLVSEEASFFDPSARAVDEAVLSTAVAQALAGPSGPEVLLAYAGDRRSGRRREEVRDALDAAFGGSSLELRRDAAARVRAALTAETTAVASEALAGIEEGFARLDSYRWLRGCSRAGVAGPAWSWEAPSLDVRRAVERIAIDPKWSSSTDAQRWGVHPLSADLVADWFPRALVELGLHEIGEDRTASIAALLGEIPEGELRYYRGWRGIPPDGDSLGVMLRLAAELPLPPAEKIESWLAPMAASTGDDGVPPVWFRRSAAGPTHEPEGLAWDGDDCTACRLSLALGLLRLEPARFDGAITAILSATLARFDPERGSFAGCQHYPPPFAAYLFALIAVRVRRGEAAQAARADVEAGAQALTRALLREQRLDGSWGSAQVTAWFLEALCALGPERGAVARAARFLGESQRGDGSWLPELVYFTVGKPGYMIEYRGIEVTTAFCARALAVAQRTARARGWDG